MKCVNVTGSKFDCCLEEENNQWFLRFRIDNKIEAESPVTHMDKKAIRSNIIDLLETVRLEVNELIVDRIHTQMVDYIALILGGNINPKKKQFGTITDVRIPDLSEKMDHMIEKLENMEERIRIQESRLSH